MNDVGEGQGSPSARMLLRAFGVADPDSTAADLEADWNRMNLALGEAVTACQLFETYVRLASPVFEADGTDELAAREAVSAGLVSRLGTSIKALKATAHADLVDGLTRSADVRNRIVHDGLIGRLIALSSERTATSPTRCSVASAKSELEDFGIVMERLLERLDGSANA